MNPDIVHIFELGRIQHLRSFRKVEPEFGLLACNMHLKKAGDHTPDFSGFFFNFFQQLQAVDALDHMDEGHNEPGFIRLQVANKMPLNIGGQGGGFGG